jgi:hypothetical protein
MGAETDRKPGTHWVPTPTYLRKPSQPLTPKLLRCQAHHSGKVPEPGCYVAPCHRRAHSDNDWADLCAPQRPAPLVHVQAQGRGQRVRTAEQQLEVLSSWIACVSSIAEHEQVL